MNLYDVTEKVGDRNVEVRVYKEDGTAIHTFKTGLMDKANVHMKEQFEIKQSGTYYIEVKRLYYKANYKFSIHPSIENGLIQDYEGEINDFMNMATPLALDQDNTLTDVSGTLNTIRQNDTSIKNTDDTDWYSLDIQTTGTYRLNMVLLAETDKISDHNFDQFFSLNSDYADICWKRPQEILLG